MFDMCRSFAVREPRVGVKLAFHAHVSCTRYIGREHSAVVVCEDTTKINVSGGLSGVYVTAASTYSLVAEH